MSLFNYSQDPPRGKVVMDNRHMNVDRNVNPPIYTSDPNDQRLQLYNDSLILHKAFAGSSDKLAGLNNSIKNNEDLYNEWSDYVDTFDEDYWNIVNNSYDRLLGHIMEKYPGGKKADPKTGIGAVGEGRGPMPIGGYNGTYSVEMEAPFGGSATASAEEFHKPIQPYIYRERESIDKINTRASLQDMSKNPIGVNNNANYKPNYKFSGGFVDQRMDKYRVGPGNRELADDEMLTQKQVSERYPVHKRKEVGRITF